MFRRNKLPNSTCSFLSFFTQDPVKLMLFFSFPNIRCLFLLSMRNFLNISRIFFILPQFHTQVPAPSPRIMSPMGFAIHRQARHIASLMDENSLYGDEDDIDMANSVIRPVPIWLCVFLVIGYIIGGAYLFGKWENWEFLDAAYFCFITLTTIGFGDFVPAQVSCSTFSASEFHSQFRILSSRRFLESEGQSGAIDRLVLVVSAVRHRLARHEFQLGSRRSHR